MSASASRSLLSCAVAATLAAGAFIDPSPVQAAETGAQNELAIENVVVKSLRQ